MKSNFKAFKTGLKQKLCNFIFNEQIKKHDSLQEAGIYYRYLYPYLQDLRVARINFMDASTLFIKFMPVESLIRNVLGLKSMHQTLSSKESPSYFMIYDYEKCKVLKLYSSYSEELLELNAKFYNKMNQNERVSSAALSLKTDNVQFERLRGQLMHLLVNKNNNRQETVRHLNEKLPSTPLSYSSNPLLDRASWKYDESLIDGKTKWKMNAVSVLRTPVKFVNKQNSDVSFEMYPVEAMRRDAVRRDPAVRWCFHPHEPFVISNVSLSNSEESEIFSFHVRR